MKRRLKYISLIIVIILCLGFMFIGYESLNKNSVSVSDDEVIAASANDRIYTFIVPDGNAGSLTQINENGNLRLLTGSGNALKYYGCDSGIFNGRYCIVRMKFSPNSGYKFIGWAVNQNCNNANVNTNEIYDTSAFTKKTTPTIVSACTERINNSNSTNNSISTNSTNNTTKSNFKIRAGTGISGFTLNRQSGNIISLENKNNRISLACSTNTCSISNIDVIMATGYEFVGWSNVNDCNNIITKEIKNFYFSPSTSYDFLACAKKKTTTNTPAISTPSTSNCKIKLDVSNGEKYTIYDGGKVAMSTSQNGEIWTCQSSQCYAKITSFNDNYKGLAGDGDCSTGVRTTGTEVWCVNSGVTVKACYNNSSSGNTSGGGNSQTDKPVEDNKTETLNSEYYAKDKEFMGKSIKCGDKLYITTCTTGDNAVCDVTSINGSKVSNTQIYKSNITNDETKTGCYQKIERYISDATYYFTNQELSENKTEIKCGSIVTFKKSIANACTGNACEVEYDGKTVYVDKSYITSDKPTCSEASTCETSSYVKNVKGDVTVRICEKDDNENTRNNIVTCAEDYEYSYKMTIDNSSETDSSKKYKEYVYTCNYIKRPGVNASAGIINSKGIGTINIKGITYGDNQVIGYYVSNGEEPTVNSTWINFNAANNLASIEKTVGTYFIWTINNKQRISYPVLAKIYDADLSTTLASFKLQDENGNDISTNISSLDNTVGYNNNKIKDSKYALLSNDLLADSIGGFNRLSTSYELSVTSSKIAIYATLTSEDASYVSGFEPRTINLDYGRNVALIKIVNKDGKERCYSFIINRVDDRNNSNLLKNIKLSKGNIDFDSYTTNYDVKISKFTKKISVNAELESSTSKFVEGYEPREVEITEDTQSVVLKVISETGSIRSYVITFIKSGEYIENVNSTYLSSLTVPGTMLGFDKETYDYTITVPYEIEDIPIYAFAENENAEVKVGNNTGLKVGNNLIQIEVKNGNKTRIYSLHVIRKESGLDVSNSAKLGSLNIKNYNIEFTPDKLDYEIRIKREKTLLISASPESDRADIYMYGNNDLTGFSTVRIKVIAENGLTNLYSIDIQKEAYNKKIEIIVSISICLFITVSGIILIVKRKNITNKEYMEG